MNWVGGVRNRIKLKQQKRQQKEFFEKKKLKSKLKLLGPPLSPQRNSAVSWDLLTLHIVNRIAAKKEYTDVSNKIIQVDMKKDTKMPIRRHNIELPMSPCSTPSQIFREESQCSTQEKEWSNRTKHFANTANLKYGEQRFLIQGGMSPLIEPTEHTAEHTDHEKIVPNCRTLPKHSNDRLLQSPLMESSGLHSNAGGEYVSFALQDTFPLPQKGTTQHASTSQSMTFFDRDLPLTQCFNSESSQPKASDISHEKFMHNPSAPAETSFKITTPYKKSDMYTTSLVDQKSVIRDRKNGSIFTQSKNNLFKEAIEKDHLNNSHEQFLESNLEESKVLENNSFFRGFGETWRPLDYRGTVLNNSFESSQSPSYSPKETESCCSAFSDMSELDGQNMQPDVSVTNKDRVQEKPFDVTTAKANFKVQNVPSQEYPTESNSTSQSCPDSISKKVTLYSMESNLVNSAQKENQDPFVPSSSSNCSSQTCAYQNAGDSKSVRGQDAWTQTECSLTRMGRSNIAIQCNLSNITECLSFPGKEPTSLQDDSNNLVHTTRGQYNPSNKDSHCLDASSKKLAQLTEKDLSLDNRIHFEELDDTQCLEARSEGNTKTIAHYNSSALIPGSCSKSEIQRPDSPQPNQSLQNEVCNLSGIPNIINQKELAGWEKNVSHVAAMQTASMASDHLFGRKVNLTQESRRQIDALDMKSLPNVMKQRNSEENKTLHEIADILLLLGHSH
uniref:regulator of DNA class I crossover intermediates 1 isoform X2 n=1 Tax=Pristiophorus japonicus TaxID=55135 RepID=UPI00398E5B4D